MALLVVGCSRTYEQQGSDSLAYVRMLEQERAAHLNGPLVVLDAGHGGVDTGAHTKAIQEKSSALQMAFMIKKFLNEKGYRVLMTRSRDVFISLQERAAIANRLKGEIFVSVHFNAHRNTDASGIEVYYYAGKQKERAHASKQMAQAVLARMVSSTGAKSRGVKVGNLCVIRETKMPAILIEGGFITNPKESKLIENERYLETLARAVSEGIDRYFAQKSVLGAT